MCPQSAALFPDKHVALWQSLQSTFKNDAFLHETVSLLSGAVQIPTQTFDDMGTVGEDARWEPFNRFREYLLSSFRILTHNTAEMVKVNTYGLVYILKGSDEHIKPLLLTGHSDVVPVNPDTYDTWTPPPFSGFYDDNKAGKYLWGRGSMDDKASLIGILTVIETLLGRDFKPARTLVLAFGFDEEINGVQGASSIGEYLLSRFGENSFAMLLDEGGVILDQYGGTFAFPAIAQKGYFDMRIEVNAPGGHSSVPPVHTTIGMLAAMLVRYENNPMKLLFRRDSPMYIHAQCLAAHGPRFPVSMREALQKSITSDKALRRAEGMLLKIRSFKALVSTTQAVDVINGGVKSNALPENAMAIVNHRIAADSSVDEVKQHATQLLKDLAAEFNLPYNAFDTNIFNDGASYGNLTLSDAWGMGFEPAPITPTGVDDVPFQLLSGTIKATHMSHRSLLQSALYYLKLAPHAFRYIHYDAGNGAEM
ncbi:carboxypeptidase S [Laetiporus sulphureus 93-53]|uniref:Carboxypeptidase S n=1 Tax=Laetiporus sulphureus 93-53 TaxID=1314785 RepID=A0A165BHR8_9APHY|nr:carboxypeptidase S [Laetiporus sulphureus 93-53]KZT01079.1 carboxypeptidase S [Laetiporus sulphureus 93-53]